MMSDREVLATLKVTLNRDSGTDYSNHADIACQRRMILNKGQWHTRCRASPPFEFPYFVWLFCDDWNNQLKDTMPLEPQSYEIISTIVLNY